MEVCFWNAVLSDRTLPCLNSQLLPKEVKSNASECTDVDDEKEQFLVLDRHLSEIESLNCSCSVRCKYVEYHVSAIPYTANWTGMYLSVPSKRVSHI